MCEQYSRIDRVLIVGAGWVGRQIAARMAIHGISAALVDRKPEVSQAALDWIERLPAIRADQSTEQPSCAGQWIELVSAMDDMQAAADSHSTEAPFGLVLECVPEQISLKKRLLRKIDQLFDPPTIVASNSSYFVPSMLSEFVEHPQRFAQVHFHVPVLVDSVADIVGCEQTDLGVIDRLDEMVRRIGHQPLRLLKEHPGYIYNWLLQSVLRSALELKLRGVAPPEMIDRSWTAVTGMPLGPFGIMDQIGLDVIEQVLSNSRWAEEQEIEPELLLRELRAQTSQGRLGTKSGAGFYDYDSKR